ncbi:MAG: hypothetical protein KDA41_00585, partial [Planctomycetales bacterium]|nr:hypothetical protein [Planctomycetales bacterium]
MSDSHRDVKPIDPQMRVVMRLPGDDHGKDPWTGRPQGGERNLTDDTEIDENVAVRPPVGKTPAEVFAEHSEPPSLDDPLAVYEAPALVPQFSLQEILLLTTMAAVGFGGARALPAAPFACLVGVLAFVFLAVTTAANVRNRWVHVA